MDNLSELLFDLVWLSKVKEKNKVIISFSDFILEYLYFIKVYFIIC